MLESYSINALLLLKILTCCQNIYLLSTNNIYERLNRFC